MTEIIISMGNHSTTKNLNRCGNSTVAFATADTLVASDYVGIVSTTNNPEKTTKTEWTVEKTDN